MKFAIFSFCLLCASLSTSKATIEELLESPHLLEDEPTVLIVLLVRNKAHVLPLFLTYLERLNFPKDRIALWIRSDHNNDKSVEILELWLNHTEKLYHSVDVSYDITTDRYQNESSPNDWPHLRFLHLIELKEAAMIYAQKIWADFIFYLDADVLLTSPDTLTQLMELYLPVVAPLLLSEGIYSNYWCGMTTDYYYQRTEDYLQIYNFVYEGTFPVPMVHSAVLVHINRKGTRNLTFDRNRLIEQLKNSAELVASEGNQCRMYDGPLDDIIVFAISANCSQVPMFISNDIRYGYILQPIDSSDDLNQDLEQLINIRSNIVHDLGEVAKVDDYLQEYDPLPKKNKLTLDHIYLINLERRPERRVKMERLFHELGLDVEHFAAVDGKKLNSTIIGEMDIQVLPQYEDPYHHRHMTMGEIGCFLSHFQIWQQIVEKGFNEVLILEDDIRFEPYFKKNAEEVLEQARNLTEYDLIYFGRKRLENENSPFVKGADKLVHVSYSYWTLGYVITLQGARKLLAAKPLQKLIPVDEFLPIMFNRHPNKSYSEAFKERNLIAFSAAPLILYPTHYTGEVGYISDTEDSEITPQKFSGGSAQLKSDRELYFPEVEKVNTSKLDIVGDEKLIQNELNGAKDHSEL